MDAHDSCAITCCSGLPQRPASHRKLHLEGAAVTAAQAGSKSRAACDLQHGPCSGSLPANQQKGWNAALRVLK